MNFSKLLIAQDKNFKIGLNIFPNVSNGVIINDGNTPGFVENLYNDIETWKPSISANLFVDYDISARTKLSFGIGYQNTGERTIKFDVPVSDSVFGTHIRFVDNHHNIEIPLNLKYYFSKRFYGITGVSGVINIINKKKAIYYYSNGSRSSITEEDNMTSFRRFNFSANLGVGYDYLEVNKFIFFVQPYFQYTILGVSKDASLNRHPFSAGVAFGLKLK